MYPESDIFIIMMSAGAARRPAFREQLTVGHVAKLLEPPLTGELRDKLPSCAHPHG